MKQIAHDAARTAEPASISPGAIALNRFGLGARRYEAAPANPQRWLTEQFDRFQRLPAVFAALPDAGAMVRTYHLEQRQMRQEAPPRPRATATMPAAKPARDPEQKAARQDFGQDVQALYRQAAQARAQSALETEAPFIERMVHFWANHFCVSADNAQTSAFVGAFERDAIRPHVLGRFEDMLLAAESHPAMLIYLNQVQSIGPNSLAARRALARGPRRGLNENLAREAMELHTLGVRPGYSQGDVTEFARALTGWDAGALDRRGQGDADGFAFRTEFHEPGARKILGRSYPAGGVEQARGALIDFSRAPATATHVATKIARHFAGDTPPPALVSRLSATFARTDGSLPDIYRALIDSPEPWISRPTKFKTPWEWAISALRAIGRDQIGQIQVAGMMSQLGQPVWKPGSPAGWDDTATAWAAPDALLRRVELAQRIAAPIGDRLDARALGAAIMPASLSVSTANQIARAESPASALALLLVSPDFLRR